MKIYAFQKVTPSSKMLFMLVSMARPQISPIFGGRIFLLLLLGFLISRDFSREAPSQEPFSQEIITAQGFIRNFPEKSLDHQVINWKIQNPKPSTTPQSVFTPPSEVSPDKSQEGETIQVWMDPLVPLYYGDRLEITGKIGKIPRLKGFDYQGFLGYQGISGIMRSPKSFKKICERCEGSWVLQKAEQSRLFLQEGLKKTLPPLQAQLLQGLVLGAREKMPPFIQDRFKASGLQHILVVSGSNIALLLWYLHRMIRPLGPWITWGLSTFTIVGFVLISGSEIPALRAGIMGVIAGISLIGGRKVQSQNLLLGAGVLLGILNPGMIRNDPGFWLSFLATLGIVQYGESIKNCLIQWKIPEILIPPLAAGLAAQIGVSPILLGYFGSLPLGGIIGGLFLEPVIALLLPVTFALGILSTLPLFLIWPLVFLGFLGAQIIFISSHILSLIPPLTIPEFLRIPFLCIGIIVLLLDLLYSKPK